MLSLKTAVASSEWVKGSAFPPCLCSCSTPVEDRMLCAVFLINLHLLTRMRGVGWGAGETQPSLHWFAEDATEACSPEIKHEFKFHLAVGGHSRGTG